MAKISGYFAQRKMPTGVGAVKMDWPSFHAGRESAAIAEFGRAFAGVGDLAMLRLNSINQSEFTSGKADYSTAIKTFQNQIDKDPNSDTYVAQFDKFFPKIEKTILKGKSRASTKALTDYFKNQRGSLKEAVKEFAWQRKDESNWANTLDAVRKFEITGNTAKAEAALFEVMQANPDRIPQAKARLGQVRANVDWYKGLQLIEADPAGYIEMAEAEAEGKDVYGPEYRLLPNLDPTQKLSLLNRAKSEVAAIDRERSEAFKLQQEQTASQFLADLWENKLTNPQEITDALRKGWLSDVNAKYLRKEMLNKEPPKTDLKAYAEVKEAINDLGRGAKTVNQTLDVVYKNVDRLDPTTGKSLVGEIFGEHDKHDATMQREGRDLMEELIREKDPISGMFTDDERQIIGTAEAIVELDDSIKKAASLDKSLKGKELLIEAIRIGRKVKREINEAEKLETPPEFKHKKKPPDLSGQEAVLGLGKGKFIPDDTRLYLEPPGYKGKAWMSLPESKRKEQWKDFEAGKQPKKKGREKPNILSPSRAGSLADAFMGKLPKLELPQPKTKAEYDKLKSGTKYIDPEGVERIKK